MSKIKDRDETHVVLGATGALGSAVVRELAKEGKRTRAVVRNTAHANGLFSKLDVEIFQANALELDQLEDALKDASIVYHCIGVPYTKWFKQFPKIQSNIIEAISNSKAKLAYADNLYMYGKMTDEMLSESHPHLASSKKGQLRSRLSNELLAKHKDGAIMVTIVRFGDFYGPNVVNGFTLPLFKNPLNNKAASWIGNLNQKHSLIYIDDAARCLVATANNSDMYGQVWHVAGDEPLTGREFITQIFNHLGRDAKMKVLKRRTISVLGIIVPIAKELHELLDQWEHPFVIDGSKFANANTNYTHTPHSEAISNTLDWFTQNIL